MAIITINGASHEAELGERLVDAINRTGVKIPQVCYHPQLRPIQTCDTCIVASWKSMVSSHGLAEQW
jgi:formate dehydrogenase major subunit